VRSNSRGDMKGSASAIGGRRESVAVLEGVGVRGALEELGMERMGSIWLMRCLVSRDVEREGVATECGRSEAFVKAELNYVHRSLK
jgi:hypothetical protein